MGILPIKDYTDQNHLLSFTASTLVTDEPTATEPIEPSKETTTKEELSSTDSSADAEATNNATIEAGAHEARNEHPGTGNVNTIIAVTASIMVGGIAVITVACFCRKR